MTALRVLLAPDKFKGSATAAEVVGHLSAGIRAARPDVEIRALPIADGGDGTVAAAVAAGYTAVPVVVAGPTGEPVHTVFALLGDRAVVEMADACGLSRLPGGVPQPMTACSFGLGQLLSAAVRSGARTVVLGIGGSASTDGGAGMLQALGARILDEAGKPIAVGGSGLSSVHSLDLSGLDPALTGVRVILASDVDNPLLGPTGAATVYAPQKGADSTQVAALGSALSTWADVVQATIGADFAVRPGAGAAGGVGFAALAVLGAEFRAGIELIFELVDFQQALVGVDLVITGEGSLDRQTLQGKGPAGVATAATAVGVAVVAVAGRVLLTRDELTGAGFSRAYSLLELAPDAAASMANPGPLLQAVGRQVLLDFQASR